MSSMRSLQAVLRSHKSLTAYRCNHPVSPSSSCPWNWLWATWSQRIPLHTHRSLLMEERGGDIDKPIKYSTSRVVTYKSVDSFTVPKRDFPKYQPWIVLLSIAVFVIYFSMLREENDLDEEMGKSLYERIPGLEESHLKIKIDYDRKHGLDTAALEKRLQEVQEAKPIAFTIPTN